MNHDFKPGDVIIGLPSANKYNITKEGTEWIVCKVLQSGPNREIGVRSAPAKLKRRIEYCTRAAEGNVFSEWIVDPVHFKLSINVTEDITNEDLTGVLMKGDAFS